MTGALRRHFVHIVVHRIRPNPDRVARVGLPARGLLLGVIREPPAVGGEHRRKRRSRRGNDQSFRPPGAHRIGPQLEPFRRHHVEEHGIAGGGPGGRNVCRLFVSGGQAFSPATPVSGLPEDAEVACAVRLIGDATRVVSPDRKPIPPTDREPSSIGRSVKVVHPDVGAVIVVGRNRQPPTVRGDPRIFVEIRREGEGGRPAIGGERGQRPLRRT